MDFLRAHHDAQLIGASTLREEPGTDMRGADYGIDDGQLRVYREDTLRPRKAESYRSSLDSGNVDADPSRFRFSRVEPWIVTSAEGAENLRLQLKE